MMHWRPAPEHGRDWTLWVDRGADIQAATRLDYQHGLLKLV
jgi:hypothetical protein